MAKHLDEFDPEEFLEAYNELVATHNDLCVAHDLLASRFKDLEELVDTLWDATFQTIGELDS